LQANLYPNPTAPLTPLYPKSPVFRVVAAKPYLQAGAGQLPPQQRHRLLRLRQVRQRLLLRRARRALALRRRVLRALPDLFCFSLVEIV
jgi:hypothetical protein